jgi:hypothetical protein
MESISKPGPGSYFLAIVLGAPFAMAGLVLLIPPFTPVGFCLILLSGVPLYRVERRKLAALLADRPLENGVEKPWE